MVDGRFSVSGIHEEVHDDMPRNVKRPFWGELLPQTRRRGEGRFAPDAETQPAAPRPARFDDGVEAKTLEEVRRRRARAPVAESPPRA